MPIVPSETRQKRKNSKANNIQLNQPFIKSQSEMDKSQNSIFKINFTSKGTNNNTNIINKKILKKVEKMEKKENNNISYLDSSILNFEKGLYNQSLKDALKSIETEDSVEKANYIAFLCYLEMYDIDSAEKFLFNQNKSKKLKNLIENKKLQILLIFSLK